MPPVRGKWRSVIETTDLCVCIPLRCSSTISLLLTERLEQTFLVTKQSILTFNQARNNSTVEKILCTRMCPV